MKTYPGERIRYLRNIIGLARHEVASKYGIPEITLRSWEAEKSKLTERAMIRCIRYLGQEGILTNSEWINYGRGNEPRLTEPKSAKDLVQTIDSNIISCLFDTQDQDILKEVTAFKELYQDSVILLVSGDNMEPLFHAGDYVGGRLVSLDDIDICVGKDCVVILADGSKHFRRVLKSTEGKINLLSINPNAKEPVIFDVQLKFLAPVTWHRMYLHFG